MSENPAPPVFTLKPQDITAGLLVETWVAVQQIVRSEIENGCSPITAVHKARQFLSVPKAATLVEDATVKELGALKIAADMGRWPDRRVSA